MKPLTTDEAHDLANTIAVCIVIVLIGSALTYFAGIHWILK